MTESSYQNEVQKDSGEPAVFQVDSSYATLFALFAIGAPVFFSFFALVMYWDGSIKDSLFGLLGGLAFLEALASIGYWYAKRYRVLIDKKEIRIFGLIGHRTVQLLAIQKIKLVRGARGSGGAFFYAENGKRLASIGRSVEGLDGLVAMVRRTLQIAGRNVEYIDFN